MRRPVALAAALLGASSLVAGCTPDRTQIEPSDPAVSSAIEDASGEAVAPEDAAVYGQDVDWESCGALECATLQVPVDWSDPDGSTVDLRINRHAATDADARLGSLLINPGGPGGGGLDFTEAFVTTAGDDLLRSYDVIGFDPRGVGSSTGIDCGDADALDAYFLEDLTLESQEDLDAVVEQSADFAERCRELSGPLIENVDTSSAARDMDVIRAVLGDAQLHYLGFSYGTQLGATYAELFPQNVGRVVLDGAVDFTAPGIEQAVDQAAGFEDSLMNFIDWCLSGSECPLDSDRERARQQIHDITIEARDEGYEMLDGTEVDGNVMVYGMVVTMYDEASWTYLQAGLSEVLTRGTADIFGQLAGFYLDKDMSSGEYLSNSQVAFHSISCLDGTLEPFTFATLQDFLAQMEKASPTFGWWFAGAMTPPLACDGWPWRSAEPVTELVAADDAAPMLVIGTTNDPATPYDNAVSLSEQLEGSTLLTYDGEGHTAYGRSNQCIIDAVDGYLVGGDMPVSGTRC